MNKTENKLVPELRFPEFINNSYWKKEKLGEIGEPLMCKRIFKEQTTHISKNNIPFYKISTFGGVADSYIPTALYNEYMNKYSFPKKGEILISASGTIGRLVVYDGLPAYFQDSNIVWLGHNENKVLNNFLYYSYSTLKWQTSDGGIIRRLYNSDLKNMLILFPEEKKEQQKIADCLSSLDELIRSHNDKLEALKNHKKGLLQNLFPQDAETTPKFRFPEFVNKGDWNKDIFGKFIDIKGRIGYRGYTVNDIVSKGEGAISLSPSNITENNILNFEKCTYITWHKYEESPEIMLKDGYTVLVKTGSSYGKVALVKNLFERATINPQIVVLKPRNIDSTFLFYLTSNTAIQKQINETVVGGAIPTLSQESISKFDVLIPELYEQQKIARCLSEIDSLITSQTNTISLLKDHKKGLIQRLFPKTRN